MRLVLSLLVLLAAASAAAQPGWRAVRAGLDVRVPLFSTVFGQDATVGFRLDVPLR